MNRVEMKFAILLSAASVAIFNFLPVYLGAAAESLNLTADKVGVLASVELVPIALAAALGPLWITRFNWRKLAGFSIAIMVLGNLICTTVESYSALIWVRAPTAFFGNGIGYALALSILSESEKPDRIFGIAIIVQVLVGALGLFFLPYLTPDLGLAAPSLFIIATALVGLPFLSQCPEQSAKLSTISSDGSKPYPLYLPLLGLAIHAVWYINVGSFWAFVERIGDTAGLASTEIGTALTLGMLVGLLGAGLAAILSDRYGRTWPMAVTIVSHRILMYYMTKNLNFVSLAVIVSLYNFTWNLGLAYLLGLIATTDSGGRLAVLIPVAQVVGTGGGPVVAGSLATSHGYSAIIYLAAVSCGVALILYGLFVLGLRRRS